MDGNSVRHNENNGAPMRHNGVPVHSISSHALKKGMAVMLGGVPHKVTAVRPNGKITLKNKQGQRVVLILNSEGKHEIRGENQ